MPLELKKAKAVELRSIGLDEKWLQDKIRDDPTLLGLGDLEIVSREHRQPVGGRIANCGAVQQTTFAIPLNFTRQPAERPGGRHLAYLRASTRDISR